MDFSPVLAMLITVLAVFVICIPFKYAVHKLHLNAAENEGYKRLSLIGVLYTMAGLCATALPFHIQHWPVAVAAAAALLIGASFTPGVDWSQDSKLKRFAYCAINFALGATVGAVFSPVLPDITWI